MTIDLSDALTPEVFVAPILSEETDKVLARAKSLYAQLERERARLEGIDMWAKGVQGIPEVRDVEPEMQRLLELARTPWLSLVVSTIAQALFVDGFKTKDGHTVDSVWDMWLANGLPSKQGALYRAALNYGYCYMLVSAGVRNGEPLSRMQGLSPKRAFAVYDDPAFDQWAQYAITTQWAGDNTELVTLYDDTFEYRLKVKESKWEFVSAPIAHGAGVVPLVRYAPMLDLDGNARGEVEPFIGVAARIDKTMFDRLLTQHYNSWKKIYVAGLKKPSSNDEAERKKLKLRHSDMMMFEDKDTNVGTLPETSLEGFIQAVEADVDELTALSQVPAYLFNGGKLSNLGADTIVAANKPFTQKVFEYQVGFEQAHNQSLRLAAYLAGDEDAASDLRSHATWQDIDVRSYSQAADALGKFATLLGVPKTALWRKIPNVTESEAQEWENLLEGDDDIERLIFEREQAAKRPAPTDGGSGDEGENPEEAS